MNIAVVGCGYVAEFYAKTLVNHPGLKLLGACDANEENADAFCNLFRVRKYAGLEATLEDPSVEMILNLTNPRSHYEVTKSCLESGKHVYSEKPLAMDAEAARRLVELAKEKALYLGSAPCSVLGETAQTIWKALREGVIGRVRLVYANFDDGMIAPKLRPWEWRNAFGVPWPAKDEFEVGCTFEHAGYFLTWLAAFFGPAKSVTAFASCQIPDKGVRVNVVTPDFTVGCIEYGGGVVARVTCGLVAPKDKSLTIVGDDGILYTRNIRDDASPVYIRNIPSGGLAGSIERRVNRWRGAIETRLGWVPWSGGEWFLRRKYPFARKPSLRGVSPDKPVDFCRGPAEMAQAIREGRPSRLSAELGLHITELIESLQYPERFGGRRALQTTFEAITPLPWAM